MSHRFACKLTLKPTFGGRKTLKEGFRWNSPQSWLARTETALKSGAVRKPLAYDIMCRVPPMPIPRRQTFRDGTPGRKGRKPPVIEFPEDRIKIKFLSDPDIVCLFAMRLHPDGRRAGEFNDDKDPGPFARPARQLQAKFRHGPLFLDKLARRFAVHYQKLIDRGLAHTDAYSQVRRIQPRTVCTVPA